MAEHRQRAYACPGWIVKEVQCRSTVMPDQRQARAKKLATAEE